MRKHFLAVLIVTLLISSCPALGADETSSLITSPVVGRVIQVIDADALAVRLMDGTIAYVRLIGVDASTKHGGLKYMQDNAYGKMVAIVPDYSVAAAMNGRWNYAYVYLSPNATTTTYGNDMFNLQLLKYGYAETDQKFRDISLYSMFAKYQSDAKSLKVGVWGDGQSAGVYLTSDKVNLNTATASILTSYMTSDTPDTVINNIVSYRNQNPFDSVRELKFVKGMTKDIYNANKHIFTVMTNINTSTEKELRTLRDATADLVDKILKYRMGHKITSLTELYTNADVDRDFYDRNRYFMSVEDNVPVTYAIPLAVVNINTASESQLRSVSAVSQSLAARIIDGRRYGYTFKTLTELRNIQNLSVDDINGLADNLHLYTDVNSALDGELESLFGISQIQRDITNIVSLRDISDITRLKTVLSEDRYDRVKDHIYAQNFIAPERVNLNTATESELREIGLTQSEAAKVIAQQGKIISPTHIPIDIAQYDKRISLYTDINTATAKELRSLNVFPESVITQILTYREDQPFGSDDEVSSFFSDLRLSSTYNKVRNFIVVR